MHIQDAQREMRSAYRSGSAGQAVSGAIWLISAVLATWLNQNAAVLALVLGGMFIFPLTQLVLRLAGHPARTAKDNTLAQLAVQVAFIVPLCIPLIWVAASYNPNLFYPAFMVVVGAHYLPFMFLYGIWQYAILGGLLIGAGTFLLMTLHPVFTTGGWFTAALLILFALVLWFLDRRERR